MYSLYVLKCTHKGIAYSYLYKCLWLYISADIKGNFWEYPLFLYFSFSLGMWVSGCLNGSPATYPQLLLVYLTSCRRSKKKWYFVTKIVLTYCDKKLFSDWEKLLKFKADSREFEIFLRSLEQFIQTVKGQNNFW